MNILSTESTHEELEGSCFEAVKWVLSLTQRDETSNSKLVVSDGWFQKELAPFRMKKRVGDICSIGSDHHLFVTKVLSTEKHENITT